LITVFPFARRETSCTVCRGMPGIASKPFRPECFSDPYPDTTHSTEGHPHVNRGSFVRVS
jgi:hypothetical protein